MVPGLKSTAYRVTRANWILFNGASAATLILTGAKPSVPFKCRITISSATGHTDCVGDVFINAEKVSFLQAAAKTSTTLLTALPAATTVNLDGIILIECLDSGGQPLTSETKTAFLCRWMDSTQMYQNATGEWSQSLAQVLTTDSLCVAGGEIEYLSLRYVIKKVIAFSKLSGREFLRRLYL